MKLFSVCVALFSFLNMALADGTTPEVDRAVSVIAKQGTVQVSLNGNDWNPVLAGAVLPEGSLLRTDSSSTADLLLGYNGSVFRLAADSELRVEKLQRTDTGLGMVTTTKLNVMRGSLVGSQRKLHRPSILEITTPHGEAIIRGTEYVVNAQGAVSVLSGSVEVNYNLPGNTGSIKVMVPAGSTFDPATGTVVPTDASYLQNVIADVNAVRENAEVYKTAGATIVVKPDLGASPSVPSANNGVGNGIDPQPPGNPPINDGVGTSPGNPGNEGGANK